MLERGESFPHTQGIVVARLLIAVVVVVIALVGGAGFELTPIVWLGIAVAVLTGAYLVWIRVDVRRVVLLHVQFATDVVFVTALAHFSGGIASPFRLLYFLPVISASARLGAPSGMSFAAGAVAGQIVLMFLDRRSWTGLEEAGTIAETAILVVSLGLVSIVSAFLARRARDSEDDLESTRKSLDTAELRLSNIVDSLRSGLVLVDGDGRLIYMNTAGRGILGIAEPGAEALDYRVVFAEVPAFCERIASALDAGRPETRVEFFVRRAQGGNVPVGLSTSILKTEEEGEQGVVAIFQDLTEARRLEERARHDDRLTALGEFAAGVAHEIRNPLNAIKGSTDLLRDTLKPEGDEAKLFDLVTRESNRLSKLIDEVLQYGRMESGERRSVRLDSLAEEIVAISKSHPSYRKNIDLVVESADPIESVVSPEQIKRALLNLTINAIESIEAKGSVRLSVVRSDDFGSRGLEGGHGFHVAVLVEDTGCGIASDWREDCFQPFKTTKKEGTGLGLAIVDKIVKAHEGRIAVATELGRGTRFVVYLP